MDYEFINVKKTPLSADRLQLAVVQLGLDAVLNSKGATYRKLGLKDMNLTPDQAFDWLLREQGMIKRPLIEKDGQFMVGFDEQAIKEFAGN